MTLITHYAVTVTHEGTRVTLTLEDQEFVLRDDLALCLTDDLGDAALTVSDNLR